MTMKAIRIAIRFKNNMVLAAQCPNNLIVYSYSTKSTVVKKCRHLLFTLG